MSAKSRNVSQSQRAEAALAAAPDSIAPQVTPAVTSTPTTPDPAPCPAPKPASAGRQAAPDQAPIWRQDDGAPVSCLEKIKVLNENYAELRQIAQDAFEDALLMGCSETQVRDVLRGLIDALDNPYEDSKQK